MLQNGGRTNGFSVQMPMLGLKSKQNIPSFAATAIHQGALGEYLSRTVKRGKEIAGFIEKEWSFLNLTSLCTQTYDIVSMKKASGPFKSGWRESLDFMLRMSGEAVVSVQVHRGSVINSIRQALVAQAEVGVFHRWRLVHCTDLLVATIDEREDPDLVTETICLFVSHHKIISTLLSSNPLVFWYQCDYLRSPAKNLSFFAGYLADWQCYITITI